MLDNGFCVGLKNLGPRQTQREGWHFEIPLPGKNTSFCATKSEIKSQWGDQLYYVNK